MENYFERIKKAVDWLNVKTNNIQVSLMIVLTGGVGGPEQLLTDKQEILSSEIPCFPQARAKGHEGKLIFGKLDGRWVVILKGRFHYYEGITPQDVVFPYFVLYHLGVLSIITTNAVGGIRTDLGVGDIVLITDHINYMGQNPLYGISIGRTNDQFIDMTNAYNQIYQELAQKTAHEHNIILNKGIYIAIMGPSYETKAEIRMFEQLGADVVGMSLVFEVIACNFLGIKVLAFAVVANVSADKQGTSINHDEVIAVMKTMAPKLSLLVCNCAQKIIKSC